MTPAAPPWVSHERLSVLGTGAALPGVPIESAALIALMVDRFGLTRAREAGAIMKRLGIDSRYLCRPFDHRSEPPRAGHSNPELAAQAVRAALADAGLDISDIGYLIGHTATPHQLLPANISFVADELGYGGPHLELRQACTGFSNALMIAFGLAAQPGARPVAIVGSETGSLFFDPARVALDNGQLINLAQMGDGAAAIIVGPPVAGKSTIASAWFGSIGLGRQPALQMHHGAREFAHDYGGVKESGSLLFDAGVAAARSQGYTLEGVDTIIPHQVSGRIGALFATHFDVAVSKVFVNAHQVGNMGSAAIWLALADVRKSGLLPGHRVLALGAEATKFMYGGFVYDHA
jgi:3-oxoacyl-[acyl-carrier-protein] synthase III